MKVSAAQLILIGLFLALFGVTPFVLDEPYRYAVLGFNVLLILALSLGPIYEFLLSYLRYKQVTLAECIKAVLNRLSIAAIVYPFIALWFGFSNIIAQDEYLMNLKHKTLALSETLRMYFNEPA